MVQITIANFHNTKKGKEFWKNNINIMFRSFLDEKLKRNKLNFAEKKRFGT